MKSIVKDVFVITEFDYFYTILKDGEMVDDNDFADNECTYEINGNDCIITIL